MHTHAYSYVLIWIIYYNLYSGLVVDISMRSLPFSVFSAILDVARTAHAWHCISAANQRCRPLDQNKVWTKMAEKHADKDRSFLARTASITSKRARRAQEKVHNVLVFHLIPWIVVFLLRALSVYRLLQAFISCGGTMASVTVLSVGFSPPSPNSSIFLRLSRSLGKLTKRKTWPLTSSWITLINNR